MLCASFFSSAPAQLGQPQHEPDEGDDGASPAGAGTPSLVVELPLVLAARSSRLQLWDLSTGRHRRVVLAVLATIELVAHHPVAVFALGYGVAYLQGMQDQAGCSPRLIRRSNCGCSR